MTDREKLVEKMARAFAGRPRNWKMYALRMGPVLDVALEEAAARFAAWPADLYSGERVAHDLRAMKGKS